MFTLNDVEIFSAPSEISTLIVRVVPAIEAGGLKVKTVPLKFI